jgi:hypothetical protein
MLQQAKSLCGVPGDVEAIAQDMTDCFLVAINAWFDSVWLF